MMLKGHCFLSLPTWEVLEILILLRLLQPPTYQFPDGIRRLLMLPNLYIANVHLIYSILWTVCRRRALLPGSPLFPWDNMGLCYIKVILLMLFAWGMVGHLLGCYLTVFVVANFWLHMHLAARMEPFLPSDITMSVILFLLPYFCWKFIIMLRLNLTTSHSQVKNLDIGLQCVMMMLVPIFILLAFGVLASKMHFWCSCF